MKSGLLASIGILVVSIASSFLLSPLFPTIQKQYQNPNLFRPWSDPLMSLYYLYPFVLGFVLAFFWNKVKTVFKNRGLNRAINFGLWFFLIGTLPGMFITYSSFQVSLEMVVMWALAGFVEVVAAIMILDKFNG